MASSQSDSIDAEYATGIVGLCCNVAGTGILVQACSRRLSNNHSLTWLPFCSCISV
ncbi:hypothetical protein BD310DRAFT_358952 [Dichomitus squalens]|uniref:Uncharacterized protein n=1 Tax=Dichomitus squalens TaxID=114155 RepID=A0A4Q9PZP1_9APHY|nr:hypothetical protein BD310DRAFT_358952 [Dichomitus squalens]